MLEIVVAEVVVLLLVPSQDEAGSEVETLSFEESLFPVGSTVEM
jgi:hypothetical protein